MREMTNCDFAFDVDVGKEGALVVDAERENAVLIWSTKSGAEECAVWGNGDRLESEAVKRGEHGELKLEGVAGGEDEGYVVVVGVFGELNGECLCKDYVRRDSGDPRVKKLTTSFLMR